MSTTGMTSWAVDLKDVTAIYPFQGTELFLTIACVVFWIGWHIWCQSWEKSYHRKKIAEYGNAETMKKAIEID